MKLRFFGPFFDMAEKEMVLELEELVTLRALIRRVAQRITRFNRFAGYDTDAELSAHAMFLRDGIHLKLNDRVENGDIVNMVLPVSGG